MTGRGANQFGKQLTLRDNLRRILTVSERKYVSQDGRRNQVLDEIEEQQAMSRRDDEYKAKSTSCN